MEENMKAQIDRLWIMSAMMILAFLIPSCAPDAQNSRTASNANRTVTNTGESNDVSVSDSDDPCKDSNLGTKLTKLKKAIEDKINNDNGGDDPLARQFNRNFYLEFKEGTDLENGLVIAYVSGAIQGEKNFKKLADFIEDFVKKGCKIKVVYRASDKIVGIDPPDGFEWCEQPLVACPGGYCAESCSLAEGNSNTNSSNGNSNGNANRGNSNSNVKRSP